MRETKGAGRRVQLSAPAGTSASLHAFVTYSYGLVNGDEIRKDPIRAGAGAEKEQSGEARSNDRGKQN